nr:hypothetical protein [Morchella crassipes]
MAAPPPRSWARVQATGRKHAVLFLIFGFYFLALLPPPATKGRVPIARSSSPALLAKIFAGEGDAAPPHGPHLPPLSRSPPFHNYYMRNSFTRGGLCGKRREVCYPMGPSGPSNFGRGVPKNPWRPPPGGLQGGGSGGPLQAAAPPLDPVLFFFIQ